MKVIDIIKENHNKTIQLKNGYINISNKGIYGFTKAKYLRNS